MYFLTKCSLHSQIGRAAACLPYEPELTHHCCWAPNQQGCCFGSWPQVVRSLLHCVQVFPWSCGSGSGNAKLFPGSWNPCVPFFDEKAPHSLLLLATYTLLFSQTYIIDYLVKTLSSFPILPTRTINNK